MKKSITKSGKRKFIMIEDKIPTKLVIMPTYNILDDGTNSMNYMMEKHKLPIIIPVEMQKFGTNGKLITIKREDAIKTASLNANKEISKFTKDIKVDSSMYNIQYKYRITSRKQQLV